MSLRAPMTDDWPPNLHIHISGTIKEIKAIVQERNV